MGEELVTNLQRFLFEAIEAHDEDRVAHLLERGASAQRAGPNGYPIHAATDELGEGGPVPVVLRLLEHGASAAQRDDAGNTALTLGAILERWDVVALFLEAGVNPHVRNIDNVSGLTLAAAAGNTSMVREMLARGQCRGELDRWVGFSGRSMLGHAANRLDFPLIRMLIEAGAGLDVADDAYRIPLENLPPRASSNPETWDRAARLLTVRSKEP
ncbi:MAG: ankyrin repeat domain-containing protein [Sandaracinaceae bacterium]